MFAAIFKWVGEFLRTMGVLSRKNAKICFLGLDNAGKTTLLQMLKEGRVGANPPTLYPNNEELIIHGIRFRTFDLGGHETARRVWGDYLANVHGIVFVVDAADRTRFAEAREEIGLLLDHKSLLGVPLAILGNKIDIPVAASEEELRFHLNLPVSLTTGKAVKKDCIVGDRPVELFMCSIIRQSGYSEAFDWLANLV